MKANKNTTDKPAKNITLKKILIYLLLLFTSPLWILPLLYFTYTGFNINPFLPQDKFALSHLQERYGQEFKIIRSTGSSWLGGPISYDKIVAPVSNPALEFTVSKCLARCSNYDHTNFTDTYPNAVYGDELTHFVQENTRIFGLDKSDTIDIHVNFQGNKIDDADIFKPNAKDLIPIKNLPYSVGQKVELSLSISTKNKSPHQKDFDNYAATIVKIRDYFASKGMSARFYYTIYAGEKTLSSNRKYELYEVYRYDTPGNGREQNEAATISKLFVKEKRSRRITD